MGEARLHGMQDNFTVGRYSGGAPEVGGMAHHFDFDGLSIETLLPFRMQERQHTFDLMAELRIGHKMRWGKRRMAYFTGGAVIGGEPFSLLTFRK